MKDLIKKHLGEGASDFMKLSPKERLVFSWLRNYGDITPTKIANLSDFRALLRDKKASKYPITISLSDGELKTILDGLKKAKFIDYNIGDWLLVVVNSHGKKSYDDFLKSNNTTTTKVIYSKEEEEELRRYYGGPGIRRTFD